MVDANLLPREWIELVQRRSTSLWSDVDELEDEHWLKGNVSVFRNPNSALYIVGSVEEKSQTTVEHTPSRREVSDAHRRAIIDIEVHQELWH